ncbi:transmembrane and immunoglobulin domain-containing protein 2 isoform X2 [Ranitomeya variabilis]|uniref:transmembrane and immunoglobulin domain-containing protein 2 isoform X2 n=1 Tax=Ranitomeya variabilis TaxID=490064 RepID=UPI0040574BB4
MVPWIYAAFYLFLHNMVVGKIITQHPVILNLNKSDTARISCNWTSEYDQQVRVEWRKQISSTGEDNGTLLCSVLKSENNRGSSARNNKTTCNVTNNTTLLTIEGVTEDDGGRYVCRVTWEIPTLEKAEGNGTQLYVQGGISDIRFLYLTTLLIIPILLIVYCLYCKRKKKKELFLDHIYGNVKRNTSRTSKQTSKKTRKKKTSKRDKKKTSV